MAIGSLHEVVVDCAVPMSSALFWRDVVGGTIEAVHDDWVVLHGSPLRIGFQRVPEPKSVKNRVHLDVGVPDRAGLVAAAELAERLGARRLGGVVDEPEG
ncbi:MAG: VOC family protein, partial [Ilumatobacteraceae bacterium]